MRFILHKSFALFFLLGCLCGLLAPLGTGAEPPLRASEKVTVSTSGEPVASKFVVKKGEWIELEVTGKWRMWDRWDYTGPQGHTHFKKINDLGSLGALVCQIGDGKPFTLADAYPFQAPDTGEVKLWANRGDWKNLKGDGQLVVTIRAGDALKDRKEKDLAAKKKAHDKLMADPELRQALALLNTARKICGLDEVKLSVAASLGCQSHARYLVLNHGNSLIAGLKAHEEHASLKGYSVEGARAARDSVIHYEPPARALSGWLATFYHRIPLLQPSLEEVGLGYATDRKKNWGCVMDCMSGTVPKGGKEVVFYPEDRQKNVPTNFCDEAPTPLPSSHSGEAGFPVTVTFAANQPVKQVDITLSGPEGAVPGYLSTPESPARRDFPQWNTVCLIPKQKLAVGKTYTVKLSCDVAGKLFSRTWSFTTRSGK